VPRALWFSLIEPQNLLNGACAFAAIKFGERTKRSTRTISPRYAFGLRSTLQPACRPDSSGAQQSAMDYCVSRLIPKGWICLQLLGCRYRVRGE
jgi:hypothetical protein